jgi:hypothetical protein
MLIPDGTFELILNFGNAVYHTDGNHEATQRPDTLLAGGFSKKFTLHYTGNICMIGVVFNPVYQNMLLNDRMDLYSASLITADDAFGNTLNAMIEALPDLSNTEYLREHIENYFMKLFKNQPGSVHTKSICTAVEIIQHAKGNIVVEELASRVCMSAQFQKSIYRNHRNVAERVYTDYPVKEYTAHDPERRIDRYDGT